jgi:hypothetical protein
MVTQLLEFLPLFGVALMAGVVEATKAGKSSLLSIINSFCSALFLCASLFLALSITDLTYEARLGIAGVLSYIGADKAIEILLKLKGK